MRDKSENDVSRSLAVRHLNQVQLARRLCLSPRTLEAWRWRGTGPRYLKLGGRIAYRIEDVVEWEAARLTDPSSDPRANAVTKADGGAA